MHVRCLFTLALCLVTLSLAYAAPNKSSDQPEKPSVATDKPAAKANKETPKPDEFTVKYQEWKKLIARLYQIQELFKSDPAADKKALQTEYNAILEKAQANLGEVSDAAERSYEAAPNQNKELDGFLIANLSGYVLSNDFERGARVAKLLTDNKMDAKELDLLAGLSFFGANDFDNAAKFLKRANDSGVISNVGKRYLAATDKYKELWEKEQSIREAEDKANDLPRVKLQTTKGDIVVVLFENEAPIATANFINLVEKKFYDGLTFHRVIPDFMAQAGDPKGDGTGGPGYTIPCECYQSNHRIHFRGSLSMANTGARDTGGSQFFLTFLPTPHLDGKHTVFGRIVQGLDVLAKLQRVQPGDSAVPDKILKATVLYKRPHPYVPVTRPVKE